MELKASSQKLGLTSSDFASDPEENEISEGEDEDDDRNHKHHRRDAHSLSLEGDSFDQVLTRPYRRRNKPFENGYSYNEGGHQSVETWNNDNLSSDRNFRTRFEKRRLNQASFSRAPSDLNHRIRGNQMPSVEGGPFRGRGRKPFSWGLHDTGLGLVDVGSQMVQCGSIPSAIFAGRGLPNVSHAQNLPWNAVGLVPGVLTGGIDALPLGLPGAMRPAISPPMNLVIPRQRCRDFEERGFCLRGDMCPMEHGLNRIVIEDVQSLSQFNLPVSLPDSQLPGTASGRGVLPLIGTSSASMASSKSFQAKIGKPGVTENGLGMSDSVVGGSVAGGSDVYDPDQPLWTNDNAETSAALLALNQSHVVETELDPSEYQNIESYERFDDEDPLKNGIGVGSQSSSVWGRIRRLAGRPGPKEKNDSIGTSSSYLEGGMKSDKALNPGLHDVPCQEKWNSADGNGPVIKELSLKPHNECVRSMRKPSQKALRTLFVNGVPLKDNKREALLSHFKKFGEVINIYIPMHSERAFVQFSSRAEAEAALKAPDAVMGNRFIKLWWANRDNIPDDGISGTSSVPATSHGMPPKTASSHLFVPEKGKENPHPAGSKDGTAHPSVVSVPVYDQPKPMATNGPKVPPQQKKLESLELLKEELRKKQEMLDQKRNEFRRQLDKLEKQASISKDGTISDPAAKRFRVETPSDHIKAETSKLSPKANRNPEHIPTTEHALPHSSPSNPIMVVQGPLRPSIRPLTPLGAPLAVNRFKLDNRPTAFRIASPIPSDLANVCTLEERFSSFGDLASVELEGSEIKETNEASGPSDISARVSFTTRRSAEKAFLHGKCWQGHDLKFVWITSTNTVKEAGGPGNPQVSSGTQSDSSIEAASTHSERVVTFADNGPEDRPEKNDGESTEQDKNSKAISSSSSCEKQLS